MLTLTDIFINTSNTCPTLKQTCKFKTALHSINKERGGGEEASERQKEGEREREREREREAERGRGSEFVFTLEVKGELCSQANQRQEGDFGYAETARQHPQ